MKLLFLFCVMGSHATFSADLVVALRKRRLPTCIEFATLSFLLYFDLELLEECIGVPYKGDYFSAFFDAPEWAQLTSLLILVITPWLLKLGSSLVYFRPYRRQYPRLRLRRDRRTAFYVLSSLLALCTTAVAVFIATSADSIWVLRARVGETLGPFIIILYFPLALFTFFCIHNDAHRTSGELFLFAVITLSTVATAPVGQRTFVLLPFLVLFLFWTPLSFKRLVTVVAFGIIGASLLLPYFKAQYANDQTFSSGVSATVDSDIARAPILVNALQNSNWLGTRVLRYSGEGYVYSLLYFVPRHLAPMKGDSTASYYTAAIMNLSPSQIGWGFGISAIDELTLNFGILAIIPGMLAWGCFFGAVDALSEKHDSLVVPSRLLAIWFLGYHLPALIQDFVAMGVVGLLLELTFSERPFALILTGNFAEHFPSDNNEKPPRQHRYARI